MLRQLAIAIAFVGLSTGAALAAGDAAKGEKTFRKCKACHSADEAKNKVGPHLVGIIGRHAGMAEGFKYSDAMKNSGITWDADTLDKYLADPKAFVAGNRMAFPGLKKEEDRQDVIAYLMSLQG